MNISTERVVEAFLPYSYPKGLFLVELTATEVAIVNNAIIPLKSETLTLTTAAKEVSLVAS